MAQISQYIDDAMASKLNATARLNNCSVSKYVAEIVSQRLMQDDAEELRKKELLRNLRGAVSDKSFAEPPEIPWDMEISRRYGLT